MMMMLRPAAAAAVVPKYNLHSSSSSWSPNSFHLVQSGGGGGGGGLKSGRSTFTCCGLRDYSGIPYLGTFSKPRGPFDDLLERNLPLIDNARFQLSQHCTTLEGEPCFDCWMAVLDLAYLHDEGEIEEVESMIREAGGAKYVIDRISEMARTYKLKKELQAQAQQDDGGDEPEQTKAKEDEEKPPKVVMKKMTTMEKAEKLMEERGCPVPDGIPPTWEELEEIERMKMPDSSYTRLLRYIGGYPSWYVPRPDHETD